MLNIPYFFAGVKQRMLLLTYSHVSKIFELTPKTKGQYKLAKGLLETARRLEVENASNKQLIELLRDKMDFPAKGKVNKITYRFIKTQLEQQHKSSRGRRYSIEDKIFALSLLKQSPSGYKLLKKIFALPSRKTLVNILNKLPFVCGLNEQVLSSLKTAVQQMDEKNRCCCLLFDEMTLSPGLQYDRKNDCLIGFEDVGYEKRPKFADHATVFMARGLRKRWKQPVAFYFSESGLKSTELAGKIKEIIARLQAIGLKVISTISDQAAANSAAISYLKDEDSISYKINGEEIIHLFDPPHLLKGKYLIIPIWLNLINCNCINGCVLYLLYFYLLFFGIVYFLDAIMSTLFCI